MLLLVNSHRHGELNIIEQLSASVSSIRKGNRLMGILKALHAKDTRQHSPTDFTFKSSQVVFRFKDSCCIYASSCKLIFQNISQYLSTSPENYLDMHHVIHIQLYEHKPKSKFTFCISLIIISGDPCTVYCRFEEISNVEPYTKMLYSWFVKDDLRIKMK